MSQPTAGWYADPTRRHIYRYWDGNTWSNQVSDGGTAGVDPVELDDTTAATPPAPGTHAPGQSGTAETDPASRAVEVTQRSGGSGLGVILGVLVGAIIVIAVLVAVFNNSEGEPAASTAPGAPVTTVAPTTTAAP